MNIRIFPIVFFFILCVNQGHSETWISIDGNIIGNSYSYSVLESNEKCYKAKVSIHGIYDTCVQKDDQTFHNIIFDNPSTSFDVGKPVLPCINKLFALPFGENIEVSIENENWTEIDMGLIYPCQKPLHDIFPDKYPFMMDKDSYQMDHYQPFFIEIGNLHEWKGMKNRRVSICPFVYHPKDNKLSVLKDFTLCINYERSKANPLIMEDDYGVFANSDILQTISHESNKTRDTNDYDYLIIVGDIPNIETSQPLADFCKWKAFKGLKTKVVTTSTTGTSSTDIKQYISYEKGNSNIKYVLLVGDYDKIPLHVINDTTLHYGLSISSDYWYGCIYDVYQACIPIGRFPASSVNDFANMVDKTIRYESKTIDYYDSALLVADFVLQHRQCMDSIPNNSYNNYYYFTNLDGGLIELGGRNSTNEDIINEINYGCNIVNYLGHGITSGWGDDYGWNWSYEHFSSDCLNDIDSNVNSIFMSIACLTGDLTDNQCMLKAFLRADYGAVSFYGATNISLSNANRTFVKTFYDKLLNNDVYKLGDLTLASNITNINSMGLYGKINALLYICGGDPSLEIWTDRSDTFGNVSIEKSGNYLSISTSSISNYYVSIVSDNGNLISKSNITGTSGYITLPTTDCYIALSKKGYSPYVVFVNIDDNYIQNETFTAKHTMYLSSPITAGNNITTSKPYGNVTVTNGAKLTLKKSQDVTIVNGFECELGSCLEIK